MATIEEAIRTRLTGTGAVAAVLGSRVYLHFAPRGASAPYVVMRRVSRERWMSLSQSLDKYTSTIQLDVFSRQREGVASFSEAVAAADAVADAIDGQGGTWAGVDVEDVIQDNEAAEFDAGDVAAMDGDVVITQAYRVIHGA